MFSSLPPEPLCRPRIRRGNAMTVGPKIFKNILKLPPKRENGTFTLAFPRLMALPEMLRPPGAIK